MRLIGVITDNYIGRLEISVDVPLRVDTGQAIHKLESDNGCGLDWKLAFFEGFLQLFQVYSKELHNQVIVILVRAVRVEPREANPPVLVRLLLTIFVQLLLG